MPQIYTISQHSEFRFRIYFSRSGFSRFTRLPTSRAYGFVTKDFHNLAVCMYGVLLYIFRVCHILEEDLYEAFVIDDF